MPRVKLDYVVSFSNEDSENQASNLLAHEVSKKKWLCSEGEPSCSVVLQLAKAVQISTVHIGAVHAALVEVLVGRSEKPNDQFEVLVPSSVFLSPMDSRRGAGAERVRSFSGEQLAAAREKRWDRVRVVCSQPYNKHCKYGLSFIHIFEPEDKNQPEPGPKAEAPAPAVPGRMMALDNFSSDEEDFRPGEMFAKHLQRTSDGAGCNTGAQIRQATSQALKNITDSSTKLVKTPITKTPSHRPSQTNPSTNSNRQKETLMYTNDDEQPHTKIDSIVQRHKDEKEQETKKKEQETKKKEPPKKDIQEPSSSRSFREFIDDKEERRNLNNSRSKESAKDDKNERKKDLNSSRSKEGSRDDRKKKDEERTPNQKNSDDSRQNKDRDNRKRPHSDEQQKGKESLRAGPVSSAPHTLMSAVVFALSGYENPRRARLRDAAVAMGARFERDWSPRCTHLICAFANTPKLKTVRASRADCIAVLGEWVERCCSQRRLLPWQWFATEPKHKVAPPPQVDEERDASECDTDDEIEKVLRKQKKQRTDKSPSPRPQTTSRDRSPQPHRQKSPNTLKNRERSPNINRSRERSPRISRDISPKPGSSKEIPKPETSKESPRTKNVSNISSDSDVAFVKDERIQGNITIDSDSDQTDEEKVLPKEKVDKRSVLPELFEGYTFVIDDAVEEAGFEVAQLARYVRAYGGVVMDASQLESESEVSYVLSTAAGRQPASARVLRPDWLWRCHERGRLCDTADYLL